MHKFIILTFMSSCLHGHACIAYLDTCIAVLNTPNYGKCRELTDEEIEQVARDEQPGHAYWQTWDITHPDED